MTIRDSWVLLFQRLQNQFTRSISNPALVIYSIAAILLFGNLSFWIELYSYSKSSSPTASIAPMVQSLITFFPAVAVPACMQLNISHTKTKSEKALSHLVGIMIVVAAFLTSTLPESLNNGWVFSISIVLTFISYLIWLIINADNEDFSENNYEAPVGGAVDSDLSGSLKGLRS